ncbi:MAG: hypothetical protein RMJ83_06985, partial [Armatimonadota bacterium]|nr:hypothetical protein [Armatimonadota bacterium]
MTFTGIVRGNTIVLDTPPDLPDGTRVSVELTPLPPKDNPFWGSWREEAALLDEIEREIMAERIRIHLR